MKSFLVAATIALVGSSMMADTALARSKRSMAGGGGLGGMAAMAPALAAGTALLGSAGYIGDPVVMSYSSIGPIDTYVEPVTLPDVHLPVYTPSLPGIFGPPTDDYRNSGG